MTKGFIGAFMQSELCWAALRGRQSQCLLSSRKLREKPSQWQLKDVQLKQNLRDDLQQFESPLCHSCTQRQDMPLLSEILRALWRRASFLPAQSCCFQGQLSLAHQTPLSDTELHPLALYTQNLLSDSDVPFQAQDPSCKWPALPTKVSTAAEAAGKASHCRT